MISMLEFNTLKCPRNTGMLALSRSVTSRIPETFLLVESGIFEILMEEFRYCGLCNPGILSVEPRIQDCLGFPYIGRQGDALLDFIAQLVERLM